MDENQMLAPIHPGEILLEEFLQPLEISQYRLAKDIGVPVRRINEIWESVVSPLTQPSAYPATSVCRSDSG